jgi:hypothetical protein
MKLKAFYFKPSAALCGSVYGNYKRFQAVRISGQFCGPILAGFTQNKRDHLTAAFALL